MRVVFCIDSLNKGGAERVVSNIVNDFCENNEIYVITTASIKSEYIIDEKVKLMSLDNEKKHKLKNVYRELMLYKYIKDIKPDIVVTFMPSPSYRTLFLKYFMKVKVIVSERNDPKQEYKSIIHSIAMRLLYKKADGFVFQTEEAKDYFKNILKCDSVIIPNPVNEKFIIDRYSGERKKEIVFVGRLEPQKNIFFLLETYKELIKEICDYKLIIYGDGSKKGEIEEYINNNQLQNYVEMKGKSDKLEYDIYKSAMFVLPSAYEGMPNALMEALALGLPCISTDCPCGGPRFLIDNEKTGLLVEVNNKEQLLDAMKKFIKDSEFAEQCGINANKKMKEFTSKKINKKWFEYIRKIKG